MKTYVLDPLEDPRWDALAASHPFASIFHSRGWLRALAKTYGYRPVAMTSAANGDPLADGIVFCQVSSWMTGSRLVSLPFTDHCELLLGADIDSVELDRWIEAACPRDRWNYFELRPLISRSQINSHLGKYQSFWLHELDLSPSPECLFHNLHKSCFQRRIRHAEKEGLVCMRGRSDQLLEKFYQLLITTRRRHNMLPQPRKWFQNLIAEMGPSAEIRLASKEGVPVAAMLTLRHREVVVYKYGCSDEQLHHFAGMPFLFWKLIEESKAEGASVIDLGRTDLDNKGLIEFKDRLGATRKMISYLRYPANRTQTLVERSGSSIRRNLFALLPNSLSSTMGQIVYRHFA